MDLLKNWGVLCLNILVLIVAFAIAFFPLSSDFKFKTGKKRRNAIILTCLFGLTMALSIFLTIVQHCVNLEEKKEAATKHTQDSTRLVEHFGSLEIQNERLKVQVDSGRRALVAKILSSSTQVIDSVTENALRATLRLNNSTTKMESTMLGGNEPFYVGITGPVNGIYTPYLFNKTDFPHYDIFLGFYDYNKMSKCNIEYENGSAFLRDTCVAKASLQMGPFNLAKNRNYAIATPQIIDRGNVIKYYIFINTRAIDYIQEMYIAPFLGRLQVAFRLFRLSPKGEKILIRSEPSYFSTINWEKEFPMSPRFKTL